MEKEWFERWFDTPYYHILYNNRNIHEAAFFIDNLFNHLHPQPNSILLDIACGKGRHARYMSEKGFDTTGIDLSSSSISYAKQFENKRLHFFEHDMRKSFQQQSFDYAFNLFTSFGYFETLSEHIDALKAFNESLKSNGTLVLDFFNADKVTKELIPLEIKKEESITFTIAKKMERKKIIKTITFEDRGRCHTYVEKVFAFSLTDFQQMLIKSNFNIVETYGDYHLQEYNNENSPRLILICKKNHD